MAASIPIPQLEYSISLGNLYGCSGCGKSIIIGSPGCQTLAYSENGVFIRHAFCGSEPCTKIYQQYLESRSNKKQ